MLRPAVPACWSNSQDLPPQKKIDLKLQRDSSRSLGKLDSRIFVAISFETFGVVTKTFPLSRPRAPTRLSGNSSKSCTKQANPAFSLKVTVGATALMHGGKPSMNQEAEERCAYE
jgi:hypothetical protein